MAAEEDEKEKELIARDELEERIKVNIHKIDRNGGTQGPRLSTT